MPAPIVVTTSGPLTPPSARKSILSVIQDACPVIGLTVPQTVFSSTEREHIELASVANEMAERIAKDTHDWTKLKSLATITGDGSTENFRMPDDYARMLRGGLDVYAGPNTTMRHYSDTDEWLALELRNDISTLGAWTLIGEDIYIKPPLAIGALARFNYLSKLYAYDIGLNPKSAFDSDDDSYILDSRLLKLGIIWQWKANKGFQYAEDMVSYEDALAVQIGSDKGLGPFAVGRGRYGRADTYAWPGVIVR